MQIFLVGGAVRDQLLGLPVHERDWVVVGATPEEMIALGFQPVGKEFPVFLHPKTKEEYALARTERKIGKGYKGFIFYADAKVSLIEDLQRRDLTINAMAQTDDGQLIDPYGGWQDLQQGLLRHVSPAFAEDPVRILRVARFAAKFPHFVVHETTYVLMRQMVTMGEVDALVPERVWQECQRSLTTEAPWRFWEVLAESGTLPVLFPTIHLSACTLTSLHRVISLTEQAEIRFAVLVHELSPQAIKDLARDFRIPRQYMELALLLASYLLDFTKILNATAEEIWQFFKNLDALRRPARFDEFLIACQACEETQVLGEELFQKITTLLHEALVRMINVDTLDLQAQKIEGIEFARRLKDRQIEIIHKLLIQV